MQSATTTLSTVLLAAAMALATGCASAPLVAAPTKSGGDKSATASHGVNNDDLYLVHRERRLYVFDDTPTYLSFLANGETPFTLTRIGAGPKGETLVFVLNKGNKKHKPVQLIETFRARHNG